MEKLYGIRMQRSDEKFSFSIHFPPVTTILQIAIEKESLVTMAGNVTIVMLSSMQLIVSVVGCCLLQN